jgi:beta-phosphoglucomutase-like phosphatase (HAD superfamily)
VPPLPTLLLELETVLADTADARRAALLAALAAEDVALSEAEYDEACVGLAPRQAARAALALRGRGDDETTADLVTLLAEREFARRVGAGVTLAPGARDFVEGAAGRARLGVVTRARRADASLILSLAGLEDAFDVVVAADDVAEPKPSPAPYRRALERLARRGGSAGGGSDITAGANDPARATIVLEDSPAGIRAAHAAGLRCVAVGAVAAHVAIEADAAVPSLVGQTPASLLALSAVGGAGSHSSGTSEARRR